MIEQLDTEDNRNRTQHKCEDAGYSNISSFPLVIINYLLKSTFYGEAMRTFVCVSFFLFFVFCFLVPLRGTENLHKSTHL